MSRDRAVVWMTVVLLMAVGFMMDQAAAVMVAAMAGICLIYDQIRQRPDAGTANLER